MVEYNAQLDSIFGALSDPIRRDIFKRVEDTPLSVNAIAGDYEISLAAVSKHIKILEQARLIYKHRQGRQHIIHAIPATLEYALEHLD